MISKVYKYKKLIICVLVILGITIYIKAKIITGNHIDPSEVSHTYTGLNYIKSQEVINEDAVIKLLKTKAELVTNSGDIEKHYTYSDTIYKGRGWLKDTFGQRTLEMVAQGHFKTGIDLSTITSEDIVAYGKTLFIKLPKDHFELISLDVPFDDIKFSGKTGLFRTGLTMEDKQNLYTQLRGIMEQEILHNEQVKENTYDGAVKALKSLLENIPHCDKVVIQPKMD